MSTISGMEEFKTALDSLSDEQQRVLGARFIAEVIDLTDDGRLRSVQPVAARTDSSAEELLAAYHSAQSAVVELSLHGDFDLIDFDKQAAYFVAKGCAVCVAPIPVSIKSRHRAWNVAHYCRAARACASMAHDRESEILAHAEEELQKTIKRQYALTAEFLAKA